MARIGRARKCNLPLMETFVLAGGCFWCLDAVYRTLKGVSDVVSGYTGGHTVSPSYHEVTTGRTGHAEAVKVVFDEAVIPASVILDVFFTLHDPRQLNRQGNDIGTQYRSAMFYVGDAQKASPRSSPSTNGGTPSPTTRISSPRILARATAWP
jgi:methionine-S-sulfoxide reductase